MKARIVRPSGFDSGPNFRAFAQDSPGRRLEQRAERGVETAGSEKRVCRRRVMNERAAFVNNAG